MSDIAPIGRPSPNYTVNGRAAQSTTPSSGAPARDGDSVQLSTAAQWLGKLRDLPEVRQDLVDRVRGEIDAGTYDTPARFDAAVDSLLEDLA